MLNSDKHWEQFGRTDPYFAVLTHEKYQAANLDDAGKREFFHTGQADVERALGVVREQLDPDFTPETSLDFGCGVGRLTIPLASLCRRAVGVDVSPSMLAEARRNAEALGRPNAEFLQGSDGLPEIAETFDFVISLIVFQHIPVERGERQLRRLIGLLNPGGAAALHFTYFFDAPREAKRVAWARTRVPLAHGLFNLMDGRPFGEPLMQMNQYDLNRVMLALQQAGCERTHLRLTNHGGHLGAVVHFQKPR